MSKISLAIEADLATEMEEILSQLVTGSVVKVTQSLYVPTKNIATGTMYFEYDASGGSIKVEEGESSEFLEKDCSDPRIKEQYEEFIDKEKATKKKPAEKKKGNCEEERRSFYGLSLKHRTIENWGENRAY